MLFSTSLARHLQVPVILTPFFIHGLYFSNQKFFLLILFESGKFYFFVLVNDQKVLEKLSPHIFLDFRDLYHLCQESGGPVLLPFQHRLDLLQLIISSLQLSQNLMLFMQAEQPLRTLSTAVVQIPRLPSSLQTRSPLVNIRLNYVILRGQTGLFRLKLRNLVDEFLF